MARVGVGLVDPAGHVQAPNRSADDRSEPDRFKLADTARMLGPERSISSDREQRRILDPVEGPLYGLLPAGGQAGPIIGGH